MDSNELRRRLAADPEGVARTVAAALNDPALAPILETCAAKQRELYAAFDRLIEVLNRRRPDDPAGD